MSNMIRVLVVDDEAGVRLTVAANLELAGLSVVTAGSGAEAVEAVAKEGPFDLVLTDLRMPGMGGVELIDRLRRIQPGVPVVLMTAHVREEILGELYASGLFAVLGKPFDVEDVVDLVVRATKRPFVLLVDEATVPPAELLPILTGCGLRTLTAKSPGEALLVIGTYQVDVCVVEAKVAGTTLIPNLLARNPGLRVIAVAADGARESLRRASQDGAFGCLERPVQQSELVRMIARARAQSQP